MANLIRESFRDAVKKFLSAKWLALFAWLAGLAVAWWRRGSLMSFYERHTSDIWLSVAWTAFVAFASFWVAVLRVWLEQRRKEARRVSVWRQWKDGFFYAAMEMGAAAPAIRFLLPPLPDFTPSWIPGLTLTCSICEDHPELFGARTRDGIGEGVCCRECGTTYSHKQPGVVMSDATNALRRKIANAPT